MVRKILGSMATTMTLKQMAWGLFILSVLDASLTDLALRTGIAYEGNPIAERLYLLDGQHAWFYLIKTVLPLMVILLSHRIRHQQVVLPFFWIALIVYAIILFFHMIWITYYIRIMM